MLNDPKMQFGMWLGSPAQVRSPKTREELAKILGVTPQTLCRWAKDSEIVEFSKTYRTNYITYKIQPHLDEITSVSIQKAKNGGAADRRLIYELAGILGKAKVEKDESLGRIDVRVFAETGKS